MIRPISQRSGEEASEWHIGESASIGGWLSPSSGSRPSVWRVRSRLAAAVARSWRRPGIPQWGGGAATETCQYKRRSRGVDRGRKARSRSTRSCLNCSPSGSPMGSRPSTASRPSSSAFRAQACSSVSPRRRKQAPSRPVSSSSQAAAGDSPMRRSRRAGWSRSPKPGFLRSRAENSPKQFLTGATAIVQVVPGAFMYNTDKVKGAEAPKTWAAPCQSEMEEPVAAG